MSFQQIQKYERRSNRISGSRLFALSTLLDITPGDLYLGYMADVGNDGVSPGDRPPAATRWSMIINDRVRRLPPEQQKLVLAFVDALIVPEAGTA